MRALIVVPFLALAGCALGPLAGSIGEESTAASTDEIPCGFSLRTSVDEIRVGQRVDVIASLRNCTQGTMRWSDPDGCGMGPWLEDDEGARWRLEGPARDDVICPHGIIPRELPPGGMAGARGYWDGTFYREQEDARTDAPPGVYRLAAYAGMGGEHGPRFAADKLVRVTSG